MEFGEWWGVEEWEELVFFIFVGVFFCWVFWPETVAFAAETVAEATARERERERNVVGVCGVVWFSCARRSPTLFVGLQRLSLELRLIIYITFWITQNHLPLHLLN